MSLEVLPIIIGAFLNLDKQAFGPFMVSRPLVVGAIMGLLLGELGYGLWLGLSAELLWLATLSLGGQLVPQAGLAVCAVFVAWVGSSFATGEALPKAGLVLSFLTLPFWAWAFTSIDKVCRYFAKNSLAEARARISNGQEPHFFMLNLRGLGLNFFFSALALVLAIVVNTVLLQLLAHFVPEMILLHFAAIYYFIPFLGLLGMAAFLERSVWPFFLYGLLASLLALSAI